MHHRLAERRVQFLDNELPLRLVEVAQKRVIDALESLGGHLFVRLRLFLAIDSLVKFILLDFIGGHSDLRHRILRAAKQARLLDLCVRRKRVVHICNRLAFRLTVLAGLTRSLLSTQPRVAVITEVLRRGERAL